MKWKKLQHNGILFPPDFKSQGIRIKINGERIEPNLIQEEMIYQWAKKSKTDIEFENYLKKELYGE